MLKQLILAVLGAVTMMTSLPDSIPDTVFDGLPLSARMLDYCRTILQIRLQQLKEYFA
jgi:hypothetical protein